LADRSYKNGSYAASTLPRGDAALFGVVKKHVEVAWSVAEQPQQQRNLSSVMNTMIGCMLQELSQRH
jgi:hypothetical protein